MGMNKHLMEKNNRMEQLLVRLAAKHGIHLDLMESGRQEDGEV